MATRIVEIEGIGPARAEKLKLADIDTVEELLEKCASESGRHAVSAKTGLTEKNLLEWVNMADLMRIHGVGPEFAELLEAAGVDTIRELATRNPANLTAKMAAVHAEKGLTRAVPSEKQVDKWIDEAKTLKPLVTH